MKRLFFILSIFLATSFFSSCSGEDETPASDELVGSVWSLTDGNRTDTFYFALGKKCTYQWKVSGFDAVNLECRYSYKAPNVTIETGANTFTGRIDGDVLSIHIFDRDLALKKIR